MDDGGGGLIKNVEALAQLAVALTPLAAGLYKLVSDVRKDAREPKAGAGTEPLLEVARHSPALRKSDLALALAYGALFSLLWTNALGVSRVLDLSHLAGMSLLLTISVTATTVLAWYRDRLAVALTGLSFLSLVIVLMTPGGGLFAGSAEETSSSIVPLVLLTVMAATYLLYLRGSSTSWLIGRHRVWLVPTAMGLLVLTGSLVGGLELARSTFEDGKAPSLDEDGRRLLRDVRQSPAESQSAFYQLASEMALVPYYSKQYRPSSRQEGIGSLVESNATAAAAAAAADGDEGIEISNRFDRASDRERRESLEEFLLSAMDVQPQEVYMLNRLRWVHPLGDGTAKARIPVPGRIAEERLRATSDYRIVKSLAESPDPNTLQKLYEYPEEIKQAVGSELGHGSPGALLTTLVLGRRSQVGKRDDLLPAFEPHSGTSTLRIQMALPTPTEARVAFEQYRKMAADAEGDRGLGPLFKEFGQLTSDVQNAWVHYLAGDELMPRYKLLRELAALAGSVQGTYNPVGDVAYLNGQLPTLFASSPSSAAPVEASPAAPVAPANEASGPDAAAESTEPEPTEPAPPVADEAAEGEAVSKNLVASNAGKQLAGALQTYFAQQRLAGLAPERLADYRDTFSKLLQADAPQASVMDLFSPESLTFAGKLVAADPPDERLKAFLAISADPVTPAVERMAQRFTPTAESTGVDPRATLLANLKAFGNLEQPERQQEALLDLLAHDLYQQPLKDLLPLAMGNAQTYGLHLEVLLASLLFLPLFVGAIFLARWLARMLNGRDVLLASAAIESGRTSSPTPPFAMGLALHGRQGILDHLSKLARKGWGTVALVGHRGIGKTRLLQELLVPAAGGENPPAIGVWITAPARFDEKEFISSVLDQVATQVERAVAFHLGAEPLAARQLKGRLRQETALHFAAVAVVFGLVFVSINASLADPILLLALTPTVVVLMAAFCIGFFHAATMQPVNLSAWLEARHSAHSQTVLMYREAVAALSRPGESTVTPTQSPYQTALWIFAGGVGLILSIPLLILIVVFPIWTGMLLGIGLLGWLFARRTTSARPNERNLMGMLRTYREYVASVVQRVNSGALGTSKDRLGLVICIDELDKIIDLGEVREFVRRIKGIFEVPGVHYYLSLAEDAFGALYLGSIDGKNEIDSSFDHVVRIRPLTIDEATAVVVEHFGRLGLDATEPRLARAVAAVTFGGARDALRLCDEVGTMADTVTLEAVGRTIGKRRRTEAGLAYELGRIDSVACGLLDGSPAECCQLARDFFSTEIGMDKASADAARIVLGCWLLALVEESLIRQSDPVWLEVTGAVCGLGGEVAIIRLADLVARTKSIDEMVFRAPAPQAVVA